MRLVFILMAGVAVTLPLHAQAAAVVAPNEVGYIGAATNEAVSGRSIIEGTLRKTGAGDLAVPLSKISSRDGRIEVLDGTLSIAAGGAYELAGGLPAALQQKAAFWLDANTNTVTLATNGQLWVQQWLDVREPNSAGPFQYLRGVGKTGTTNDLPVLVQGSPYVTNGMSYIDFGVFGCGRWMEWQNAASNRAPLASIRNVFLVFSSRESYGFLLGNHGGGTPDFHIANLTSATNNPFWSTGDDLNELLSGRTYLDRQAIDGTKTWPKKSCQLLEVVTGLPCYASNFCNDRNIYNGGVWRLGGGHFCEVLLYTNLLTEAERLQVQQYLWQKWLSPAQDVPAVTIAQGRTSTVAVASANVQPLKLGGSGTVVKSGTGVLQPQVSSNAAFTGEILLSEGGLDVRLPLPCRVESTGVRFEIATNILTLATNVPADQVVKAGAGEVVFTAVPASVTRLDVNEGLLNLTQPIASETWPADTRAVIPNAGFEEYAFSGFQYSFALGGSAGGWTWYNDNSAGGASGVYYAKDNVEAVPRYTWIKQGTAPEGHTVLLLKQLGSVDTTLSLPADGVYDLSFWGAARTGCWDDSGTPSTGYVGHEFDIVIDLTQRVATVQTPSVLFQPFKYRLPWLPAGSHALRLRSLCVTNDYGSLLDDFRADLVSPARVTEAVPNAGFECMEFVNRAYAKEAPTNALWSFISAGSNTAGIVTAGSDFFNTPADGRRALYLQNLGQASVQMVFPSSGTYELVIPFKARKFQNTYKIPVNVTVSVGGSGVGTLSTDIVNYYTTFVSQPFSATSGVPVTLTFSGVNADTRMMLIDRITARPYVQQNIVKNGSFEATGDWTLASLYPSGYAAYAMGPGADWGMALLDGTRRMIINRTGIVWQPLTLSQPGAYRLSFYAVSRVSRYGGFPSASEYGLNPLAAWISRGSVTNVIGYVKTYDEVFRRHEFAFSVPEAGTYTLGFQGQTPSLDKAALIDAVSVEKVTFAPFQAIVPKNTELAVAGGAKVVLNFLGTNSVDTIRYNGKLIEGTVSAVTHPEFVAGSGTLYSPPKGALMFLR